MHTRTGSQNQAVNCRKYMLAMDHNLLVVISRAYSFSIRLAVDRAKCFSVDGYITVRGFQTGIGFPVTKRSFG